MGEQRSSSVNVFNPGKVTEVTATEITSLKMDLKAELRGRKKKKKVSR